MTKVEQLKTESAQFSSSELEEAEKQIVLLQDQLEEHQKDSEK